MKLILLLLGMMSTYVNAQVYPSHPVKLIVPFPAGIATDQVARLIGSQLQEGVDQPFVVENKAGAAGAIAAAAEGRAGPRRHQPRGLGVTSAKRTPLAPDVPALAEELPGYELIAWFTLVAPAKTPPAIVQKLHETAVKGLARPDVKDKFATIGVDVAPMNPTQLAKFIEAEIAHWAKLLKLAGIQPEYVFFPRRFLSMHPLPGIPLLDLTTL